MFMPRSAKALRKIFLERHKEWTEGVGSREPNNRWEKRMTALMNLVKREREIRTAPQGKLRIVHVDARDHTPPRHGDYADAAAVQKAFSGMLVSQYREMEVYNDQGKEVEIE